MFKLDGSRPVTGDILPAITKTYDLGSYGKQWKSAFISHDLMIGKINLYAMSGRLQLADNPSGLYLANEIYFDPNTSKLWVYSDMDFEWKFVQLGT